MYDVIVIGAGPAGCMAAKRISETGYSVLLVEKMELPREKSCSGILIGKSMQMVEEEFGKIPDTVFSHPQINQGIIITNEKGKTFKFESEGYNIWRSSLDHWMSLKAENTGVKLRPLTAAVKFEEKEDHVLVEFMEIKDKKSKICQEKARMVIGCDGTTSKTRRNLRNVPANYITTYQTFSKGTIDLDSRFFHAFLDPALSEYDAWFNVKDDFLIIGVGVKNTSLIKTYHSRFVSFLKSHYNAQIGTCEKEEIGMMPEIQAGFQMDLGKGRVLLAGDAAGLLNPMGEGISSALASGYAAAEAIKNRENPDDILHNYQDNLKPTIKYMIRQWRFLGTISPKFNHYK